MDYFPKSNRWDRNKLKKIFFIFLKYILPGFIFSLIIVGVIMYLFNLLFPDFMPACSPNANDEISAWLSFISSSAAIVVASVAWFKVGAIQKQNEGNFLLHIDERWSSLEAINARIIIHNLYRGGYDEYHEQLELIENGKIEEASAFIETLYKEAQRKFKGIDIPPISKKDDFIQAIIGLEILKISTNVTMTNNFIHLLNFLDFMETVGYLKDKGHVDEKELFALCGEALVFNFNIFKPYICHKREKHQNLKFYENFEKLINPSPIKSS